MRNGAVAVEEQPVIGRLVIRCRCGYEIDIRKVNELEESYAISRFTGKKICITCAYDEDKRG